MVNYRKNFLIDSGRARRADQFDIYQHGVSKAYKWKKIGVEKVRPPAKTATPLQTVLWGFDPLTTTGDP